MNRQELKEGMWFGVYGIFATMILFIGSLMVDNNFTVFASIGFFYGLYILFMHLVYLK